MHHHRTILLSRIGITGLTATAGIAYATVVAVLYLLGRLPRHRAEAATYIAGMLFVLAVCLRRPAVVEEQPCQQPPERLSAALVGFLLVSVCLFYRLLSVGLLSDDFVLLDKARQGLLTSGNELFRPGPQLIWVLAEATPGVGPAALHLLNVLLHGVNAWLVYVLAVQLGLRWQWGLLAGILFLAGAASVEPVAWISALFEICLTLGALVFVISSLSGSLVAAMAGLTVALVSKETAVIVPLLGLILVWASGRSLRVPIIGGIVAVAFVLTRMWLLPPPDSYFVEPSRYVIKEMVSRVVGSLSIPWARAEFAHTPLLPVLTLCALSVLFLAAVHASVSRTAVRLLLALTVWMFLAILPVYSYFFVSDYLEGSRYLYLPSVAWSIGIGALAGIGCQLRGIRWLVVMATLCLVASGSYGAIRHQHAWLAAAQLRDSVLLAAQDKGRAHGCTSVTVMDAPDILNGVFVFRNGLPEALARAGINPREGSVAPGCTFRWSGGGLVRIPE